MAPSEMAQVEKEVRVPETEKQTKGREAPGVRGCPECSPASQSGAPVSQALSSEAAGKDRCWQDSVAGPELWS